MESPIGNVGRQKQVGLKLKGTPHILLWANNMYLFGMI
jgi:hypothetical protein